ncbi:MAG: NAD(P)-dependent oxidoreductase [Thermoplasmatales archaeon]|nr:NAD(P)-dependent oxidoreductase [Thermoplasmatales archaeon]
MNVLITGNRGYVGSILTKLLIEKGYNVTGLDANFYKECNFDEKDPGIKQIDKDIRNISADDLKDIDAVIHLAALSNDPLGEFDPDLTYDINYRSTIQLAKYAKEQGADRFVYSSSQSMYGISKISDELDEDDSEKNPLTAYAKTKWDAECELKKLCSDDFTVACFRPSTVFGVSPSLRCDIVYNNLVACAYTTGTIEIKSDGTPWRPVIHVRDASNAFIAGLEAPKELVSGESFNIGIKNGNYTVRDLAEAAQKVVKDSTLAFTGEHGSDSRTYKVSFKKILSVLKDYYKPEWDLMKGGKELVDYFDQINFTEEMFRSRKCNRLPQLKYLIENQCVDNKLFWKKSICESIG